jgi:hypothetical protein
MEKPRVLLCGGLKKGNYEDCWFNWLKDQGYQVLGFDYKIQQDRIAPDPRLASFLWHFWRGLLDYHYSQSLESFVQSFRPDLILIVSGRFFKLSTLEKIKLTQKCLIFHYYGEYLGNPLNTTKCMLNAAPAYDYWFTANRKNFQILTSLNISNFAWIPFGYDPTCHAPQRPTFEEINYVGSDIVFIGTWEFERAEMMSKLQGYNLQIWGGSWNRLNRKSWLFSCVRNEAVYCSDMSKVINASKICLSFLRKANKDSHTCRTFEIPACGGFQVSERTEEILDFFTEDVEIVCFNNLEELREKIDYYLTHGDERNKIAQAGYKRVIHSHYSYTDRIQKVMSYYE